MSNQTFSYPGAFRVADTGSNFNNINSWGETEFGIIPPQGSLLNMVGMASGGYGIAQFCTGISAATATGGPLSNMSFTASGTGYAPQPGDLIIIGGVSGIPQMNGTWQVGSSGSDLLTLQDGIAAIGTGSWSSGGWILLLSPITGRAGPTPASNWSPFLVGANTNLDYAGWTNNYAKNGTSNLADTTNVGTLACLQSGGSPVNTITIVSPAATNVDALVVWDLGSNQPYAWYDGRIQVTVSVAASTSDTLLYVEPLSAPIPSGTTIGFSDGSSAVVTSANAAYHDGVIQVSSLASGVAARSTADVVHTNAQLPFTPDGSSNVVFTIQNQSYGLPMLFAL